MLEGPITRAGGPGSDNTNPPLPDEKGNPPLPDEKGNPPLPDEKGNPPFPTRRIRNPLPAVGLRARKHQPTGRNTQAALCT